MLGALMPKATIHEDCDFRASEDNIWPDAPRAEFEQQIFAKSQPEPLELERSANSGVVSARRFAFIVCFAQ